MFSSRIQLSLLLCWPRLPTPLRRPLFSVPYCPVQVPMSIHSSNPKNQEWAFTWKRCLYNPTMPVQVPTQDPKVGATKLTCLVASTLLPFSVKALLACLKEYSSLLPISQNRVHMGTFFQKTQMGSSNSSKNSVSAPALPSGHSICHFHDFDTSSKGEQRLILCTMKYRLTACSKQSF